MFSDVQMPLLLPKTLKFVSINFFLELNITEFIYYENGQIIGNI